MTAPALPEVRQCQDPDNHLFGATAVAGGPKGSWGVMHPGIGGHWATPEEVADWPVIQPAGTTAKAPDRPPVEAPVPPPSNAK
jgi:hypothetical protein